MNFKYEALTILRSRKLGLMNKALHLDRLNIISKIDLLKDIKAKNERFNLEKSIILLELELHKYDEWAKTITI